MAYITAYPPAWIEYTDDFVTSTSYVSFCEAYMIAYGTHSVTGTRLNNSWEAWAASNQRVHINLGSAKVIKRIYYQNFHNSGSETTVGARHFTFWGSNESSVFSELTYGIDTNWTELTCASNEFAQHTASDVADPQYILVTNSTAYQYYAVKIADSWGDEDYMGLRLLELQENDESGESISINDEVIGTNLDTITLTQLSDGSIIMTVASIQSSTSLMDGAFQIDLTLDGSASTTSAEDIVITRNINALANSMTSTTSSGTISIQLMATMSVSATIPSMTGSGVLLTGGYHSASVLLPLLTITGSGISGTISSSNNIILPSLTIDASTANMLSASLTLPMFTISANGYPPLTASLNVTLPLLQLGAVIAIMATGSTIEASNKCYALNTNTNALSEYTNFPFNSFCYFNGKNLAAYSGGIVSLEGSNDDGVNINSSLNFGIHDFEMENFKRVDCAYIAIDANGDCYLKVTADDGDTHSYPIYDEGGNRTRPIKTKIGKGKKGRYFEFEITNSDGSDFKIHDILLLVEVLARRV